MVSNSKPFWFTTGHVSWSPDFKAASCTAVNNGWRFRALLKRALAYMECHTDCRGEECPCGREALEKEIREVLS